MDNNIIRVTKAQKLEIIKSLLPEDATHTFPGNDKKAAYVFNREEMVKFLNAEIDLLKRKNTTTGDKKLTKDQQKNEEYKGVILAYLMANPKLVVTSTDAMEKILRPAYPDILWTNQKAASLLNALSDKYKDGELVSEGKLERVEGKGKTKTTFQIRPKYAVEMEGEDGETEDTTEDKDGE